MKLKIKTQTGQSKKEQELPKQFNEPVNPDLIKRAVLVLQSNKRQKYGSSPGAGKRASAYLSKRRNSYRSTYGIGQSRTPRKVMSRRGQRLNYVGAFAPQTVGGRRAHPPKSEKNLTKKINKKEKRKAIRSAMSANILLPYLNEKNYAVPKDYPFKTITAGSSLGIEDRYIGWYERSLLTYASLTNWTLLYLMAKGIEIVEEPLPRSEKRRKERESKKNEKEETPAKFGR